MAGRGLAMNPYLETLRLAMMHLEDSKGQSPDAALAAISESAPKAQETHAVVESLDAC